MEWLKEAIDKSLDDMSKEKYLMMMPGHIPKDMLDSSIPPSDDWRGWKPIESIITDEDINIFEQKIGHRLPLSYRHYLKYKHFFALRLPDISVNLHKHLPDKSLTYLQEQIFDMMDPEMLIGRNYIYFADFHDYGLLCFDANEPREDNEYKIVFIDHENLEAVHEYANSFKELLEADDEYGNRLIDRLNEYYQ